MAVYYDTHRCKVIDCAALIPIAEGADRKCYKKIGMVTDDNGNEYAVYKSERNWYAVYED